MEVIETNRLLLRSWCQSDEGPFIAMNQDPKVMRYFPSLLTVDQSLELIDKIKKHQNKHGFSLYAVELKATHRFIGFCGLMIPSFKAHFTPAVEIGWRIDSSHWRQGYATEAAKAVLHHAFHGLHLKEVVSFTAVINKPSIRVMEKIGMHHDVCDDFNHPQLDHNDSLSWHVLYRMKQSCV